MRTHAPAAHERGRELEGLLRVSHPGLTPQEQTSLYAQGVKLVAQLANDEGVAFARVRDALAKFDRSDADPYLKADDVEAGLERFGLQRALGPALSRAKALEVAHQQKARYRWLSSTIALLGPQGPATQECIASMVDGLDRLRAPHLRTDLTRAMVDGIHAAGAQAFVRFAAASTRADRPHTQAFAAALGRLYVLDDSAPPPALLDVLSHRRFKEGPRLQAVSGHLLTITGSHVLAASQARRLIELAASEGQPVNRKTFDAFVKSVQRLAMTTQAVRAEGLDLGHVRSVLAQVQSPAQLDGALDALIRTVLPGGAASKTADAAAVAQHIDRYLSETRQPEAFLNYALSARAEVAELGRPDGDAASRPQASQALVAEHMKPYEALLETIDRYADAVIWSADKAEATQAFAALRYDTQASPHLAQIAANAPAAWEAWRSPLDRAEWSAGSRGLTIVDTDDAQDLLLCGTEVASCLQLEGNFDANKALMGYVVDGKYRMLAAKGDDGQLKARRMLRLLCDEQGQPALHLEGLYLSAGIENLKALDAALIGTAKQKAAAMACPLLGSKDPGFKRVGEPVVLASLGSRAPFEHVDARDDVAERVYKINARAIA